MVVIKVEHHQISMDMNGLVEVIESQELGLWDDSPTITKRHCPPNSCVVDVDISKLLRLNFLIKSWNLIISPTWKLDLTTSTTGLGASRSTVTTCFSSSFSTLPALLVLVERRAATWAANQVFLCCFDKMKDSSYVKITTTDWKTGTMKATNKILQKNCNHTHIHLLCLILFSSGQWYWKTDYVWRKKTFPTVLVKLFLWIGLSASSTNVSHRSACVSVALLWRGSFTWTDESLLASFVPSRDASKSGSESLGNPRGDRPMYQIHGSAHHSTVRAIPRMEKFLN